MWYVENLTNETEEKITELVKVSGMHPEASYITSIRKNMALMIAEYLKMEKEDK